MSYYTYGEHQPAGAAILAQQLHHERQRAEYWEARAKTAESHPRARKLPLTNANGDIEPPLHSDIPESE